MGYLRKTSFLIFHDPGAPAEEKTLTKEEIAEIEAAHEAGKQDRVDALIRGKLGIGIPQVYTERQQVEALYELAVSKEAKVPREAVEDLFASDDDEAWVPQPGTREALITALVDTGNSRFVGPAEVLRAVPPIVTEAEAAAAKESAAARIAGPDGARWRAIVQATQDASTGGENAFKEYLRTTFPDTGQKDLRDFGWDVYGVVTSKAKLPDLTYRPSRSSEATVRFRDGGTDRLGINSSIGETRWDSDKQAVVATGQSAATLWVKVADGAWSKDGNWGGRLQITCATAKGQWIDSSDGWVRPQSAKGDPVSFYDMGPYYEIWQGDRDSGRPLIVQDGYLRFVKGATPGKFNLQDATWD